MTFPISTRRAAAGLALLLAVSVMFLLPSGAALAQSKSSAPRAGGAQAIGEFGAWQALTYKESGSDVCYVASLPKKSEGHSYKPGEANILVTHWPARKNFGIVSIATGYEYKKDSHVELQIGSDKFSLFTQGNRAWANDGDDAKIVQAFKGGRDVVVRAMPVKGARTTDSYSLDGFSKAYEAASKACHVKG